MARQIAAGPSRGNASRGRRPKRQISPEDDIPAAYRELLEEAEARDPAQFSSDRPVKKRRVENTRAIPVGSEAVAGGDLKPSSGPGPANQVQTVYDSPTEDEDSDIEWEDVQVPQAAQEMPNTADQIYDKDEPLIITLDQTSEVKKQPSQKWKPLTGAEKKIRLDVHKTHLLCLLAHVDMRNKWCNDTELKIFLRRMVPKTVIALLHPPENKPGYARSVSFMNGLNQVADIFNKKFRVTNTGLKRSHWADNDAHLKQKMELLMFDAEIISSREDFRSQAKTMQGSRDFGAQLFCALLRSVTIDARIVCSLQPLPFGGGKTEMKPSKTNKRNSLTSLDEHNDPMKEKKKNAEMSTPSRARRIGRPGFTSQPQKSPSTTPKSMPQESPHPVFWVEAFNEGVSKWIVADPVVTKTLAKPEKMEPPANDPRNALAYVVAFEDDASARDVTHRYAKAFNAKTRKNRVESTPKGERWWHKVLLAYEKPFLEDRDEVEINDLASLSAAEPMPRNISDFKNHPIYALKRHLYRSQALYPSDRVIGHVGLSKTTANSDNLEPVYRRSDVHTVRSASRWYRLGRDVKAGEQPLKHLTQNRTQAGLGSDEEEEENDTALYAEFQTELYCAPPVVQGRIPKNAYGNLDVYVPSMVPPGAVHIRHKEASRAARILGIDYADAVTGFDFHGRQRVGTAVINGVVIAKEFQEALQEVLLGFADEKEQAAADARTEETLRLWRLFLLKLRISERVKGYASEGEDTENFLEQDLELAEEGGGFFPEGGFLPGPEQAAQSPLQALQMPARPEEGTSNGEGGGFVRDPSVSQQNNVDLGGGFLPEEPMDEASKDVPMEPTNVQDSPLTPRKPSKRQKAKTPHYDLIVVPNKAEMPAKPSAAQDKMFLEGIGENSNNAPTAVSDTVDETSISVAADSIQQSETPARDADQLPEPEDPGSEIEKGSLLSEDPDDEDAIPDWLL